MTVHTIFILVGGFIVIFVGMLVWLSKQSSEVDASILDNNTVLFYGEGCPHCADVEEFIVQNDIASTVSFTRLEVWHSRKNGRILDDALKICDIDPETVGVPLLFSQNKCYKGTPDVKAFFKNAAGM